MDTGDGTSCKVACFAMICYHCGERYIEFFPNAKQENLFIGMIHAFKRMGVPGHVLTDNMKSVVLHRDSEGHPVWNHDYEAFMNTIGFETKLCRPRHPFTKGSVERLVRFVKENFLAGRVFGTITDLNYEAWKWCDNQNNRYHKAVDCIPHERHSVSCIKNASILMDTFDVRKYLCPIRCISFDGFVTYEGRRFGIPYSYVQHPLLSSLWLLKLSLIFHNSAIPRNLTIISNVSSERFWYSTELSINSFSFSLSLR